MTNDVQYQQAVALQQLLKDTGRYFGRVDGSVGPETRAAVVTGMADGPDTRLTTAGVGRVAASVGIPLSHLVAVCRVEAAGAGFEKGSPKILFEPHRFARSTGHKWTARYPTISYRRWGSRPYPKTQAERYAQLLAAIGLDVGAGFMSASYGLGQVLGENYRAAGYRTPWEFAFAMGRDEETQLAAMVRFMENSGLIAPLRAGKFHTFALGYNGPAAAQHDYGGRLERERDRCAARGGTL